MTTGAGEVLLKTELFTDGITPSSVERVAKVVPALFRKRNISLDVIGGHEGLLIGPVAHIGLLLCQREIQLPTYNLTLGRIEETTYQSTLYIGEFGDLVVCEFAPGKPPREGYLGAAALNRNDQGMGSIYDGYGSREAGEAITRCAWEYGILEELVPFAASDPSGRP